MEEGDDDDSSETSRTVRALDKTSVLAVSFKNGLVYIMKNYDDVSPIVILSGLQGLKMEWTNAGDILAMAGCTLDNGNAGDFTNVVQFYTENGVLRYTVQVPSTQHPVSALTWGHNDKRLFVATGPLVHVGWVTRKVASLQLLSRLAIYHRLQSEDHALLLLLPKRLKNLVVSLFAPTIQNCFPESSPQNLRKFVCRPPLGNMRYYCTMIRHDDDLNLTSGTCYTLYLEYLGGLVPLLKGKRSSKLRPEFIIYDPQVSDSTSSSESSGDGNGNLRSTAANGSHNSLLLDNHNNISDMSDSDYEDGCASPRMQRRRKQMKRLLKEQLELELRLVDNLAYIDTLPEQERLVEVTSNIWGTKFKMHGVETELPSNLGQVTYKTSLLHLQPRQMTLCITELRDDLQLEADPSYVYSEDEDELQAVLSEDNDADCLSHLQKEGAPIAPMTPRKKITTTNGLKHHRNPVQQSVTPPIRTNSPSMFERVRASTAATVATIHVDDSNGGNESEPDEFPYVDFTNSPDLLNIIRRESQTFSFGEISDRAIEQVLDNSGTRSCDRTNKVEVPIPRCNILHADLKSTSFLTTTNSSSLGIISGQQGGTADSSPRRSPTMVSYLTPSTSNSSTSLSPPPPSRVEQRTVPPRWAEKACDLKYIDEDEEGMSNASSHVRSALPQSRLLSRCRSHSVGHLNNVDIVGTTTTNDVTRVGSLREMKRRLILSQDRPIKWMVLKPKLVQCGKSRSLDSGPVFQDDSSISKDAVANPVTVAAAALTKAVVTIPVVPSNSVPEYSKSQNRRPPLDVIVHSATPSPAATAMPSPIKKATLRSKDDHNSVEQPAESCLLAKKISSSLLQLSSASSSASSSRPSSPLLDRNILSVTPPTPKRSFHHSSQQKKECLRRRSLLNSPLLSRRSRRGKVVESSDEEITFSGDESPHPNFRDLESFQKAHIKQKLRKERLRQENSVISSPGRRPRRQLVMHNKAPLWNENSQVYQLDFGGRVTQESAKNFQIEFRGKQVMQFGRIDGNAYTLDFQYPFTAIQAFAVALANVTQRLK